MLRYLVIISQRGGKFVGDLGANGIFHLVSCFAVIRGGFGSEKPGVTLTTSDR